MLFLVALWLASHYLTQPMAEEVSYSEFKQMVRTGRLSEVTPVPGGRPALPPPRGR